MAIQQGSLILANDIGESTTYGSSISITIPAYGIYATPPDPKSVVAEGILYTDSNKITQCEIKKVTDTVSQNRFDTINSSNPSVSIKYYYVDVFSSTPNNQSNINYRCCNYTFNFYFANEHQINYKVILENTYLDSAALSFSETEVGKYNVNHSCNIFFYIKTKPSQGKLITLNDTPINTNLYSGGLSFSFTAYGYDATPPANGTKVGNGILYNNSTSIIKKLILHNKNNIVWNNDIILSSSLGKCVIKMFKIVAYDRASSSTGSRNARVSLYSLECSFNNLYQINYNVFFHSSSKHANILSIVMANEAYDWTIVYSVPQTASYTDSVNADVQTIPNNLQGQLIKASDYITYTT